MRKRMRTQILALCLLAAVCAAAGPWPSVISQEPSLDLPPDLARVLTDYVTAWEARDPAALARLFTEDGFVLPEGHPPVRGRAAIEKHYTGAGGPLALRAIAFGAAGNVGYIIGGFARAKGEPDRGKFTLTLRKSADGRWLIVSDMDNDNEQRPACPGVAN